MWEWLIGYQLLPSIKDNGRSLHESAELSRMLWQNPAEATQQLNIDVGKQQVALKLLTVKAHVETMFTVHIQSLLHFVIHIRPDFSHQISESGIQQKINICPSLLVNY